MRLTKTLSALSPLLALAPGALHAQTLSFDFGANSVANYRQSPTQIAFEGGTFSISARDGNVIFQSPCRLDEYFPPGAGAPGPWLPGTCPLGATGYISEGDIDGDGNQDSGTYLSATNVIDALLLRPFVAQQAQLIAAPPSLLPRPLAGFVDDSNTIFYNIQTNFIRQFAITRYDFNRQYTPGERTRYDGEAVPGTYRYLFGSRTSTTNFQPVSITIFPRLDGFREVRNQRRGVLFTNITYDDGFVVLDPGEINTISWTGNGVDLVAPALDTLHFSIKRITDNTDPLSDPIQYDGDPTTLPIFPNFQGINNPRVLLPSVLEQSYTVPPQFLAPGTTGVVDLEFTLNRPTSTAIGDRSISRFRLPVKVSTPFFVPIPPPPNITSAAYNDPAADVDNDGISNFDEWVFGSDRGNAASTPESAKLSFMPAVASTTPSGGASPISTFTEAEPSGCWEYKVNKVRNPDPKLNYEIQRSTDMVNWTTIKEGDPDWILVDDDRKAEIKVTSRDPEVKGGGFFRAKVTVK